MNEIKNETLKTIDDAQVKVMKISGLVETDELMPDDSLHILVEELKELGKLLEKAYCGAHGGHEPIWVNPGGDEPNMHCKYCGEDIG